MAASRGIRNRNPLNIRISNNHWVGKIPGTDKAFETFDTMTHGVRAAMVCMRTHVRRAGGTLPMKDLIAKWAPSSDGNNPSVYAACVILFCKCWGIELDTEWPVDVKNQQKFCAMVRAMAKVECGQDIGMTVINDAYKLL